MALRSSFQRVGGSKTLIADLQLFHDLGPIGENGFFTFGFWVEPLILVGDLSGFDYKRMCGETWTN